jgi:hypothetical protein
VPLVAPGDDRAAPLVARSDDRAAPVAARRSGRAPASTATRSDDPVASNVARSDDRAPSIAVELALLEEAQTALRTHAPGRALVVLNEHAAKYPKGALAEERDGLRVVALCNVGRSEAALAAERFLADHPASPLAGPVRDACAMPRGGLGGVELPPNKTPAGGE